MRKSIQKLIACLLILALTAGRNLPAGAGEKQIPREVWEVLTSGVYTILDPGGRDVTAEILREAGSPARLEDPDTIWRAICEHSCSLNWTRIDSRGETVTEENGNGETREIIVYPVTKYTLWSENLPQYGGYIVKIGLHADIRVNASANTIIAIENPGVFIDTFNPLIGGTYTGAALSVQYQSAEIASGKAYVTARYYLDLSVSNSVETVRRGQYYDAMIIDSQGTITFQTHHDLSN